MRENFLGSEDEIGMIGNSVGEVSALLCAGVFDLRTALEVLGERARVMNRAFDGFEKSKGIFGFLSV